jgi:hypothetical protein
MEANKAYIEEGQARDVVTVSTLGLHKDKQEAADSQPPG